MVAAHIDHVGLAVTDLDEAGEIYRYLFDMSCVFRRPARHLPNREIMFLENKGLKFELIGPVAQEAQDERHVALVVDDIDEFIVRLRKLNLAHSLVHYEDGSIDFLQFRDPFNNRFEVSPRHIDPGAS